MKIQIMVCTACRRREDSISVSIPGRGADPETYTPATIRTDVRDPKLVYVTPHKPECHRVRWAKG